MSGMGIVQRSNTLLSISFFSVFPTLDFLFSIAEIVIS